MKQINIVVIVTSSESEIYAALQLKVHGKHVSKKIWVDDTKRSFPPAMLHVLASLLFSIFDHSRNKSASFIRLRRRARVMDRSWSSALSFLLPKNPMVD